MCEEEKKDIPTNVRALLIVVCYDTACGTLRVGIKRELYQHRHVLSEVPVLRVRMVRTGYPLALWTSDDTT